jgi:hypothetical protein
MVNPWFGRKGNGYTGGPVTWQGWLTVVAALAGAIACQGLLAPPIKYFASGGCLLLLILVWWFTYDPDTESW